MFLEEIEVHNWRGIQHQLLRLKPGLNIIHGANESGKSSLRQAIRAAFLQNPTSKTREALAVKSWGSKSAPSVRVDFQLDGDRWRIEKLFFSPKGSRLSRNGAVLAKDADVHKKLEALLSQAVWLGSLWSEQGDTSLPEVPRSVRGKLVAEEVVSPGLLWLEDQLKRQEAEYWTPQGRPKKLLQDARGRAADADEAADDAAGELEETNAISEAMGDLHEELQQTRVEETELTESLADLRQKVGAWDRHRASKAEWETRVAAVLHQAEWLQRWQRYADQLASKWNELKEYQAKLATFESQALQEPTRDGVDAARARMDYVSRLGQKKVHQQLEKLKPATAKQLGRMRQLENELARSEAALQSMSMKLSLTALAPLKPAVWIDEGDRATASLSSGETRKWDVLSQAKLVLPGVAELSLESGASDAADLAAQREHCQTELSQLLHELGCQTVELAQQATELARDLQAMVEGKAPTENELARLAENAGEVKAYDTWTPDKLREEARSLRSDVDEAEARWNTDQRAYQKHRLERETLALSNPRSALEMHHDQLSSEARKWPLDKGAPEIPRIDKLTDDWMASLQAGATVKPLRSKLENEQADLEKERSAMRPPEGEEVTPEAIAAIEADQQRLAQQRERLVSRLNQDLGRLRERTDQYHKLVHLREQHAALQAETSRAELKAAAIQMLNQAFREARSNLQSDIVGPLRERVALRLARFTGDRYRGLKLDETLSPTGVIPRQIESAELTDLSFGTQEQLMFLTRLCLAEMLSEKHQRQCLIFDDNLVHTDDVRMETALEILSEASAVTQILVLTCHPARYQKLGQAVSL
jgi:uncharacterized protein YhaN